MSNIDKLEHYPMPDLEPASVQTFSSAVIKGEVSEQEKWDKSWDDVGSKEGHQRVNQNSGEVEWYTPKWLLDRVKRVLGDIDLDPASCSTANLNVGASNFFTPEDDSLNRDWNGVVWMNHPYGKGEKACRKLKTKDEYRCGKDACKKRGYHIDHDAPGNADWVAKFVNEFMIGNITKAGCITFASTSENWFRPLYNFHQVWLYDRVAFVDKHGNEVKGSTKGSVLTFMGVNKQDLEREFADIGKVK